MFFSIIYTSSNFPIITTLQIHSCSCTTDNLASFILIDAPFLIGSSKTCFAKKNNPSSPFNFLLIKSSSISLRASSKQVLTKPISPSPSEFFILSVYVVYYLLFYKTYMLNIILTHKNILRYSNQI